MPEHRFSRVRQLFGDQALERLRDAHVLVAGLGAVGSYAVEGLARSGVGHLRIVDFDCVRTSNINRQLYALESTIGHSKVATARQRILDINPDCQVEAVNCFIDQTTAQQILTPVPDVLIDAIDSLGPKIELLAAGVGAGVGTVLSAMGAASRTDPSMIRVGDISETQACPLARFVRKRLKRRGIEKGIRCVYSMEPVPTSVERPAPEDHAKQEWFSRGRTRQPLGSFACLTGIFGLTIAREAIIATISR